mmetsp:Transcript_84974/g.177596  ORF Transcript_84974/g.177596 Transcript_84974/m.177596 type:complete len:209 (+) Transcript_84974:203-829(+)|eukprot:CAMPEP_0206456710 /NCGR_PEP_ID=MMETSP0324_2-20121206/22533_1 /ASSEMBLY_ACC=CAM_ASM_000836 /TAXON_ID=2866 /ORGANISM="Crypthecodinium cohnii, Strain Seligo" /LENGTH=208 /DNA_ID=CAMNT_0053927703 /DNA_START=89 /DNA_END=715 /DNA_ORIENTATION=+
MALAIADIQRVHFRPGETEEAGMLRSLMDIVIFSDTHQPMPMGEWLVNKSLVTLQELEEGVVKPLRSVCTETTCPCMSAGGPWYAWKNDEGKNIKVPAPIYVSSCMSWIEQVLVEEKRRMEGLGRDEEQPDTDLMEVLLTVHKYIFRVYAHAYTEHAEEMPHDKGIDFRFKHWLCLTRSYGLVKEEELQPLKHLIDLADRQVSGAGRH